MDVRAAAPDELDALTTVWYDAWRDAHAEILPNGLVKLRTWESFRARLQKHIPKVRVIGAIGLPLGFSIVLGNELYQLFVAASARGTGVAAALIADAEDRIASTGAKTAWLACAIGNDRAARFYEKSGWRRTGTMTSQLETLEGKFPLEVWRYEKQLAPAGAAR
jgi:GNAT superfamily N-acetyltransferase